MTQFTGNILKMLLIVCVITAAVGCGDGGDKGTDKGKDKQEASCQKSGTIANFIITCTQPIESYETGNITLSPQSTKITLNGVEVSFSDGNKVITGKDAGSGQTSMSWELTLKGGKIVLVTIP